MKLLVLPFPIRYSCAQVVATDAWQDAVRKTTRMPPFILTCRFVDLAKQALLLICNRAPHIDLVNSFLTPLTVALSFVLPS